jgi:hypothetical protein
MINRVKNPFRALVAGVLNEIIDAVNRQKPLRASGIYMDETPSGTFISTLPVGDSGQAAATTSGGTSSSDNLDSLTASVDDLTAQVALLTSRVTILETYVNSLNALLNGVTIKAIVVVDPSNNCAQSTVNFLIKQ